MVKDIRIEAVLNGWVAEVGCQRVAFTDKQTMLAALSDYYANPAAAESRWLKNRTNETLDGPLTERHLVMPPYPPVNEERKPESAAAQCGLGR